MPPPVTNEGQTIIIYSPEGLQGPPGPPGTNADGTPVISLDADNMIELGSDNGLFVPPNMNIKDW